MNKAIFLDRDGTINVDFGYVYKTQELELLPGVAEALRIFQELGYLLIVIRHKTCSRLCVVMFHFAMRWRDRRPASREWKYPRRWHSSL